MSANEADTSPVYVVFGATGGIGAELCKLIKARGGRLVIAARDAGRLNELATQTGAIPHTVDATRFDEVDACIADTVQRYGRLDGVVNCIGSLLLKPAHSTSETEFNTTIAANLTTAFAVVRAGAKNMTNGGAIVLVSSAAGRLGLANHEAIAAAKAGVIGLTVSSAATYAGRGIRINCVAPGLVRTPLTTRITANEASLKASTGMHALGRIGEPIDVASAIDWLLSPTSTWITGQVLGVDGGLATIRTR